MAHQKVFPLCRLLDYTGIWSIINLSNAVIAILTHTHTDMQAQTIHMITNTGKVNFYLQYKTKLQNSYSTFPVEILLLLNSDRCSFLTHTVFTWMFKYVYMHKVCCTTKWQQTFMFECGWISSSAEKQLGQTEPDWKSLFYHTFLFHGWRSAGTVVRKETLNKQSKLLPLQVWNIWETIALHTALHVQNCWWKMFHIVSPQGLKNVPVLLDF